MVSFDSSLKNLSSNGSLFFFWRTILEKKRKRGEKKLHQAWERGKGEKSEKTTPLCDAPLSYEAIERNRARKDAIVGMEIDFEWKPFGIPQNWGPSRTRCFLQALFEWLSEVGNG